MDVIRHIRFQTARKLYCCLRTSEALYTLWPCLGQPSFIQPLWPNVLEKGQERAGFAALVVVRSLGRPRGWFRKRAWRRELKQRREVLSRCDIESLRMRTVLVHWWVFRSRTGGAEVGVAQKDTPARKHSRADAILPALCPRRSTPGPGLTAGGHSEYFSHFRFPLHRCC